MLKARHEKLNHQKINDGNGSQVGVVVLDKQYLKGNKISGYVVRKINYLATNENDVFDNTFFDKKKEALEAYERAIKTFKPSREGGE